MWNSGKLSLLLFFLVRLSPILERTYTLRKSLHISKCSLSFKDMGKTLAHVGMYIPLTKRKPSSLADDGRPPTVSPQTTHQSPPPLGCVDRWTDYINQDNPDTGSGDIEKWSSSQLAAFCPNGKITQIECVTTTGIQSYSTGEIAMCTIEGGSVCLNDDNAPLKCSDYKIRYFCKCNGKFKSEFKI